MNAPENPGAEHGSESWSSDVDDTVRRGLNAGVEAVGRLEAPELASRLAALRASEDAERSTVDRRRRNAGLAVAAALVAVLGGLGVWLATSGSDSELDVVAEEPEPDTGPFAGYEPGWHEIDTSSLPTLDGVTTAFVGNEFVVAGLDTAEIAVGSPVLLHAYDVSTRSWRKLPSPPFTNAQIVGAGDRIVAVAGVDSMDPMAPPNRPWAVLDDLDGEQPSWSSPNELQVAPGLANAGTLGPRSPSGWLNLMWTGERVIDMTHGAVLDPSTGGSEPVEMPTDLVNFTHLLSSNALWTGEEVVLASLSEGEILQWDARGRLLGPAEGPLQATSSSGTYVREATAVGGDGWVVLFDRTGTGEVTGLDPATGDWVPLPRFAHDPAKTYCPMLATWVAGPVVEQCADYGRYAGAPLTLRDGEWQPGPGAILNGRGLSWLGVDGALIAWNSPPTGAGPYVSAGIWIPEDVVSRWIDRSLQQSTATTTSTPAPADSCGIDLLPDLGALLPEVLTGQPARGAGGVPDSGELCSRHWSASADSGTHVTQSPGALLFGLGNASASGEYRWGSIEDGFGLEFTGDPAWSAVSYGIGESDFDRLVERLLEGTDRTVPTQLREVRAAAQGPTTGSGIRGVSAAAPGGDPIISIEFEELPSVYVSAQQGAEAYTIECQPTPSGADWYVTVQLTTAFLEPADSSPFTNVPLEGAGLPEVLDSTTACSAEGTVVLVFGIEGPRPLTIRSDESAGVITIDLSG